VGSVMRLRPYQQKWLNAIRDAHRAGHLGVIGQMPTGAGKTVAGIAAPCRIIVARGGSALLLVHRDELVRQTADKLEKFGLSYGVIAAKWGKNPNPDAPIQIAMVQTLRNRLDKIRKPTYIIVDECHLAAARTYTTILDHFHDVRRLGLTATPCRMDGAGLESLGSHLIQGPTVGDMNAIWRNNSHSGLVPARCWSIPVANLAEIRTNRHGEYDMKSAAMQYEKQSLVGDVVDEYIKHAKDRKGIVFCTSVEHSISIVDDFTAKGIKARHIDGSTPTPERVATLKALETGDIQVITNCSVLVEGLDITSIGVISLAVPTRSLSKYLQMVGRASRPHPGKTDYLVLDHGGCVLRHGTPDHEREWSIKAKEKGKRAEKGMVMARVCKDCMFANPPEELHCQQCGTILLRPRKVDTRKGTLVEVKGNKAPVSARKKQWLRQHFYNKKLREMDAFYEEIA